MREMYITRKITKRGIQRMKLKPEELEEAARIYNENRKEEEYKKEEESKKNRR